MLHPVRSPFRLQTTKVDKRHAEPATESLQLQVEKDRSRKAKERAGEVVLAPKRELNISRDDGRQERGLGWPCRMFSFSLVYRILRTFPGPLLILRALTVFDGSLFLFFLVFGP